MDRLYNFSAGPSMLPDSVLLRVKKDLVNYKNTGQSVMEMSHRSAEFLEIINKCEELLREVLNIPSDYTVLFLQGGASTQFAMVPLNFMAKKAAFALSGVWSEKAYKEAQKFGQAYIIASSKHENYAKVPKIEMENLAPETDYLHFCYNNTIYGTKFSELPAQKNVPIVCDISSYIASEPLDISKFSLLYASAQKNLGIAGLTIVIIKNSFLKKANETAPTMLSYKIHAEKNSLFNTPPSFAIYICALMLNWLKNEIGGLREMQKINRQKAQIIYDYIDNSAIFSSIVEPKDRSTMNVVFSTNDKKTDNDFVNFAKINGILNIKGHRNLGGMRASIYNAMPIAGVKKLVEIMYTFEKEVGKNA